LIAQSLAHVVTLLSPVGIAVKLDDPAESTQRDIKVVIIVNAHFLNIPAHGFGSVHIVADACKIHLKHAC
jgi:hypothetical protein